MTQLEIKTTQQIVNRFSFDDAPKYEEWISKESLKEWLFEQLSLWELKVLKYDK